MATHNELGGSTKPWRPRTRCSIHGTPLSGKPGKQRCVHCDEAPKTEESET